MNTETEIADAYGYELEGAKLNKARNVIRFIDMMKRGVKIDNSIWMQLFYDECIDWACFKDQEEAIRYLDPEIIPYMQTKEAAQENYNREMFDNCDDDEDWEPVKPSDIEVTQDMLDEMFKMGTYEGAPLDRFIVGGYGNEVYYVKKSHVVSEIFG